MGSISKGIVPVGIRQLQAIKHGANFVKQSSVHALGHAIVLQHIWSCDFMSNALILEVLLQFAGDVLAPSIRAERCGMAPCLNFSPLYECLEAIRNFGFKFDTVNKDFPRLVIDLYYEVDTVKSS